GAAWQRALRSAPRDRAGPWQDSLSLPHRRQRAIRVDAGRWGGTSHADNPAQGRRPQRFQGKLPVLVSAGYDDTRAWRLHGDGAARLVAMDERVWSIRRSGLSIAAGATR